MTTTYKLAIGDDIRRIPDAVVASLSDMRKFLVDNHPSFHSKIFTFQLVADGAPVTVVDDAHLAKLIAGERAKGSSSIKFVAIEEDWDVIEDDAKVTAAASPKQDASNLTRGVSDEVWLCFALF